MKNVICAIARNEKKYIADFCNYHLNLGFDEIHIYDNGQNNFEPTDKRIIIHPFTSCTSNCPQLDAYKNFNMTTEYDWCAFIDIDEFITLVGYSKIDEYLNTVDQSISAINIFTKLYGDDGLIVPDDLQVPVYERIKIQHDTGLIPIGKFICRKNKEMIFKNPHKFEESTKFKISLTDGTEINQRYGIFFKPELFNHCYIRHYKTKTLSEFCDQKLNTARVFNQKEKRTIDYYFKINEKTPEKLEYLKSRGIEY